MKNFLLDFKKAICYLPFNFFQDTLLSRLNLKYFYKACFLNKVRFEIRKRPWKIEIIFYS